MSTEVKLEALGQLFLLQNALYVPTDEKQLGEMVCAAFISLPGVDSACLYLAQNKISCAHKNRKPDFFWPEKLPVREELPQTFPNCTFLQLRTGHSEYGSLVLRVADATRFDPYRPHLENSVNFISLIIENKKQAAELIATNQNLENEVARRIEELSLSEQRLSIAMKGAKCGLWDYYFRQDKLYFNSSYFTMAGYEVDEFPHEYIEWQQRVHPEDISKAEQDIRDFWAGKTDYFSTEFRFRNKRGDWMWILSQGEFTEWDEAHQPVRMTGLHIDISAKKEIEAELEMHREKLHELVDEKTEQLQRTMKLMVGREVRMAELKGMISKLQQQLIDENIKPQINVSFKN